jgi:hypothetical protein
MKQLRLAFPVPSLALLGCLLALSSGTGWCQTPIAQRVDVNYGEPKLLSLERPVDDFSVSPENIVTVSKVDSTPNQLSLIGIANGSATLTVKTGGQTMLYDVAVSPAPERLYINLNESKRLTFASPIDDTSVSLSGIVRVVQPDSADNVLLVDGLCQGPDLSLFHLHLRESGRGRPGNRERFFSQGLQEPYHHLRQGPGDPGWFGADAGRAR